MKNKNMRLKGQLRMYMQWPLIMTILLLAMNIWMYMTDQKAGLTMTVFVIIYAIIVGLLYFYNRSLILADLIQFSTRVTCPNISFSENTNKFPIKIPPLSFHANPTNLFLTK